MNIFRSLLCIYILGILSCASDPFESQDHAVYTSDHFLIHFSESEFTFAEVEHIAEKKERLLTYLNDLLELEYQGTISATLFLQGDDYAYASTDEQTYESRNYVISDNGHEIAHIITFETLGYSHNGFLKEGIAVACELDFNNYNAIENYVTYRKYLDAADINQSATIEKESPISLQLMTDQFDYSYYCYQRAGAFIKYLINKYGISKVKDFYTSTTLNPTNQRSADFKSVFGVTILDAEKDFITTFFPGS